MYKKMIIISLFFSVHLNCPMMNETQSGAFEWQRSTPGAQDLDPMKLDRLVIEIRSGDEYPDIHSLLILRNGYLVVEEYFDGYDAESMHTLQSVSKSFTSALIGIAIELGVIKSVNQKILGFFPELENIENLDDRKRAIRLEDILTMRTGTDYHEEGPDSPHYQLNALSTGWDTFYLNRPMIADPGTTFQYDSGGVILLSSILKNLTGMHADTFADRYLFNHLNITRTYWYKNSEGHPHTGGGLHLSPRDMAKFGLLYLRGGMWEGRQIIPAHWIEESSKLHVQFDMSEGSQFMGYGYLWWILRPDPSGEKGKNIYAAIGLNAQYIFIVPEHDMVIIVTGGTRTKEAMYKPVDFLYSDVLSAVRH